MRRRTPAWLWSAAYASVDRRAVYSLSSGHTWDRRNEHVSFPVNEVFARVDGGEAGAHTVAVSEPQARELASRGPQTGCVSAECVANTSNGNEGAAGVQRCSRGPRVMAPSRFFTSMQQLTDEATQESNNLYSFSLAAAEEPSPAKNPRLVDVSAGEGGVPAVVGRVCRVWWRTPVTGRTYTSCEGCVVECRKRAGSDGGRRRGEPLRVRSRIRIPSGHLAFITHLTERDANEHWRVPRGIRRTLCRWPVSWCLQVVGG